MIAGLVTSGGWRYTLEQRIGLGYVRIGLAKPSATLELDVLGDRRPAGVDQEPFFDPNNSRLRA